jgi:hypothetical protein
MIKLKSLIIILGFFTLLPGVAFGQVNTSSYTLLEPLPCIEGTGQNCTNSINGVSSISEVNIENYIRYVFKLAIAIAVFLATVEIIWGGFEWMLSAVPYVKLEGKKRISNAIFGLLAALASYLILRTIDPRLVLVNTRLPQICPAEKQLPGGLCDMTTLSTFSKIFQDNLKQASGATQLRALEIQNSINDLDREKIALDAKLSNKEIDQATYTNKLAELQMKRTALQSDMSGMLSNQEMTDAYAKATLEIQGLGVTKIDPYIAAINKSYDKYVATLGNDPIAKQKLEFTKKYFITQVEEDFKLAQQIKSAEETIQVLRVNQQTGTGISKLKADLGTTRAKYKASLDFLESTGVPETQITQLNVQNPGPTTLQQAENPTAPQSGAPAMNLTSITEVPPILKQDAVIYNLLVKVKADPTLLPLTRNIIRARINNLDNTLNKIGPTGAVNQR